MTGRPAGAMPKEPRRTSVEAGKQGFQRRSAKPASVTGAQRTKRLPDQPWVQFSGYMSPSALKGFIKWVLSQSPTEVDAHYKKGSPGTPPQHPPARDGWKPVRKT